jgi:hypothetical protein
MNAPGTVRRLLAAWLVACLAPVALAQDLVEPPITDDDRNHWAFRPLVRPAVPAVKDAAWPRNPVDAFILARLEAEGLAPMPEADRVALIRRLSFDLTGLPSTPGEVDAFLADQSPDAYERLVERLLASTACGERFAQHWLDLARYADTDGFEHDLVRPNAWRYRDWVIDALNRDLPYDEFVRRQIAGDLLEPDDASAAIATGFLLCGPDMPDINDQEERRHNVLNEMTGAVGSVLLGLQVGCAQCHDHKFDPVSQLDFYRLRAFFEPAEMFKDHSVAMPEEEQARQKAEAEIGLDAKSLQSQVDGLLDAARQRLREKNPDLQPTKADLLAALEPEERRRHEQLSADLEKVRKLPPLPLGRVVHDGKPRTAYLMVRGDHRRRGQEVQPAFPRIVAAQPTTEAIDPRDGRLALARWITLPDHPLALRVIANRLWQFHFGEGLARSPSDFGRMGMEPTHGELLDWLAAELPRRGWSVKEMHRLLVTSATYRQASRPPYEGLSADELAAARERFQRSREADPENRLWWRMSPRRLEGEAIRDAMLAAAARLSAERNGPGVRPPLPPEIVGTLLKNQWDVTPDEESHFRRSIYLFVRRNLRFPLFEAFDRPDANQSCPRRNRSTTAPQALVLLNSEFSLSMARDLAGLALHEASGDMSASLRLCYRRALGRSPTPDERSAAGRFVAEQAEKWQAEGVSPLDELDELVPAALPDGVSLHQAAALTQFCLALFNLNEFVYVD